MKISLFFFSFLPLLFFSQMKTDRPGKGKSSEILDAKTIQLESGAKYNRKDLGFSSEHLLRFGLTEKWEVRLETDQNFTDSAESTYKFSSKFNLIEGENHFPSLTLIGTSDFEFDDYSFTLASDLDLTENLGAAANVGYKKEDLDFLFVSFGLEYTLNQIWGLSAEYSGNFNSTISTTHNAEIGLTYLASSRLKLDISAGSNVQNIKDDYFIGAGLSYQFN